MWRWTGSVFGSANGLSPVWRQAIPWTNAALLSIGHLGTNFGEIWIQIKKLFIHENAFKTVACEMATNLFRGRGVNFLILFSRPLLTENTKQQKQKMELCQNDELDKTGTRLLRHRSGPCFNIKTIFPGMVISIIKIRLRLSYFYNENPYTGKMVTWYWKAPCWYQYLSARLRYLQCIRSHGTTVLH